VAFSSAGGAPGACSRSVSSAPTSKWLGVAIFMPPVLASRDTPKRARFPSPVISTAT
jgi:hypothetical protein